MRRRERYLKEVEKVTETKNAVRKKQEKILLRDRSNREQREERTVKDGETW